VAVLNSTNSSGREGDLSAVNMESALARREGTGSMARRWSFGSGGVSEERMSRRLMRAHLG
jgi:hypothetical protein